MKIKKNPKADLSRWSSVFFLTGLVVMLFLSYSLLEWKSFEKSDAVSDMVDTGNDLELEVPITEQLNTPPPPPPPPNLAQQVIEVIENDLDVEETLIESTEADQNSDIEIIDIQDIEEVKEEEDIPDVPFAVIEDVPIYPGCEGESNNTARKSCMEQKVMQFVQNKFNTELANDLGLEGRQRISVQFKIDKNGNVVDVRARAPHPKLEEEAIKIIKSLPKMVPGKQRGKPVGVLYALPILFKVETGN
ncbi:MAG TPA: energy transducer TonB [Flavobacteriaceae bacterium]|nr:energy transducer TonB [Flavobacteriaceae bacterium]MCB9213461.1 energy transducer TonB [Alteromonas sp.]HPF12236.1 energy transducer TonB [Flavobacteriaceae bacterium]HQU21977.1 energy transducer TonB [Flavobacteriaceae bacterium]HQU65876.1 energy transducer TonB [Flavobacteriaceae bacterium]